MSELTDLESSMTQPFSHPDPTKQWREGTKKTSFNYLLLDPRVTKNLPKRAKLMGKLKNVLVSSRKKMCRFYQCTLDELSWFYVLAAAESFKTFLSSVFYVGKGKKSRAFAHFKEALKETGKQVKVSRWRYLQDRFTQRGGTLHPIVGFNFWFSE